MLLQTTPETKLLGFDRNTAFICAAVFLFCFGFYAIAWPNAPLVGVDTPRYLDAARDLRDLRFDHLQYRTPGYPLLLLLTGSADAPTRALFFVALALHFAAVWMVGTVLDAMRIPRSAIIGTMILLSLPPFVENAAYALSETLTQFTLVAGCVALFHWYRKRRGALLLVSALAFAYCGLTRPTYQVVGIAAALTLAICWLVAGRRASGLARATAALVLAVVLFTGGYSFLNYTKFGFFGTTPMLGFHLSTKTLRVLERIPDRDAAVREILIKHRDAHLTQPNSSHTGYMFIWSAVPELEQATGMNTAQLSRYMMRLNLRLIAAAPMEYVMEIFRAIAVYWSPSVTPVGSMNSRALQFIWAVLHFAILAVFALQALLTTGASALLAARWRRTKSGPLTEAIGCTGSELLAYALAATMVLYTMLVSVLVESGVSRVRTPGDIFMILMIPIGFRVWLRQIGREEATAATTGHGTTVTLISTQREQCAR